MGKKYNLLLKWLNKTNKKENLNQDSGVIENYKLVEQFDNSERRGGVRKNSGAKKKNNARIKSSITLEPELKKWCTNQPEKLSKLVSEGLELLRLQKNK